MQPLPDLSLYSHEQKDALIRALWEQVQTLTVQVGPLSARVAELEAKLSEPPKTPGNSSVPPSQGHKAISPTKGAVKLTGIRFFSD